ncbi:hypothetical protein MMC07_001557, partial [Pseudocyphellaria aurata]|nr:hypothetical protein [Pseudocyphellaria aurata]
MAPHPSTTATAATAAQTPHHPPTTTPHRGASASTRSTSTSASHPPHHHQASQQPAPIPTPSTSIGTTAAGNITTTPVARSRQYTHLHAQLAQLNAHLADTENLLHMTAVQADYLRGLGAWWGGA